MEKNKIADIVMKLFLYGDMCKMIHYSTEKMHGHKLCDEVRDTITEFADDLAEKGFGHTGKPDFSDFSLKLSLNSSNDIAVICKNAVKLVEDLRKEIEDNDEYSGIVSIIDDFKSDMAQKIYLANFDNVSTERLNECVKKALNKVIRENAEVYSTSNWKADGNLGNLKPGTVVDDDVIEELLGALPPATYSNSCFQPGEPETHYRGVPLYRTFKRSENGSWVYVGLMCLQKQNKTVNQHV